MTTIAIILIIVAVILIILVACKLPIPLWVPVLFLAAGVILLVLPKSLFSSLHTPSQPRVLVCLK